MIPQQLVSLLLALTVLPLTTASSAAEEHKTERDISYREQPADDAQRERCLLDIHHPVGSNGFTTLVWFHGGGLTKGERQLPKGLCNQGIAVVGAGYRLASQAKAPASIDDAAAAVAWTVKNIDRYGGSPRHIVVCGASAGGYLALMVGLDRRWLAAYGVEADTLAGIIPYSGQCITHFAYRAERGIPETQPVVDELAPLYHVRRDAPPILLRASPAANPGRALHVLAQELSNDEVVPILLAAQRRAVPALTGFSWRTEPSPPAGCQE